MENNGKGTGIFYGVIGVATLIITIIGATFAYFSATTNSDEGAVTAGGATITLGYDDSINEANVGLKTNLIPIDTTLSEFNKGGFVGITADKCKDVNGNNICSVYQFTVSNPSTNTVSQRIYGSVTPKTNTFENFAFAIFKGTASDVDGSDIGWDVDGTAVTAFATEYTEKTPDAAAASRKNVIGNPGDLVYAKQVTGTKTNNATDTFDIDAFEQVLDVGETMTYTIVMWIPEINENQNNDQGKAFAAGVNFTTEGNNTGVTGVLSTTSQ